MREREKCFFFFEKVLLLTPYTVIGKREIGERIAQLNHSINVWRTRRIESFDFFFPRRFGPSPFITTKEVRPDRLESTSSHRLLAMTASQTLYLTHRARAEVIERPRVRKDTKERERNWTIGNAQGHWLLVMREEEEKRREKKN